MSRGRPGEIVGANVRRRRAELGLGQRELARATGLSYPTMSRLENGHTNPRLSTLLAVAAALDTTVSELARGV